MWHVKPCWKSLLQNSESLVWKSSKSLGHHRYFQLPQRLLWKLKILMMTQRFWRFSTQRFWRRKIFSMKNANIFHNKRVEIADIIGDPKILKIFNPEILNSEEERFSTSLWRPICNLSLDSYNSPVIHRMTHTWPMRCPNLYEGCLVTHKSKEIYF